MQDLTKLGDKTDKLLDRGFHFIVVLWGEQFRNYFLEYCLPSMLSPSNIPALRTRNRSKFLIATRPEDWECMRATAIFRLMEHYVTPVFIEIPPCPSGRSGCEHMGVGHKLACEYAFREKAYGVVVTPDSMLSDGSVARLQEKARAGIQLVLAVALRFGEEPFLVNLRSIGVIPEHSRRDVGKPLTISGKQMAWAAVHGLHSETLSYEWDSPYLVIFPAASWWRVPNEDGILIHSLSWAPLLIDYASVEKHDTSTFDDWTLDGDYIHRNLNWREATHVVRDSDEVFLSSWAPMTGGPPSGKPWSLLKIRALRDPVRGAQLRRIYYSFISDPLKRELFFQSVRWHSKPLNASWGDVERRALDTLNTYLEQPKDSTGLSDAAPIARPLGAGFKLDLFIQTYLGIVDPLIQICLYRRAVFHRVVQVLRGDKAAWARVSWHARFILSQVMQRPFNEHPPRRPS